MWSVFIGSIILSSIHALIPNHWLPLIAIAKTEKWSGKETLSAVLITGFSHTLSTIFIGVLVGIAGMALTNYYNYIMQYDAPAILLIVGLIYILRDTIFHRHHHSHGHLKENANSVKGRTALLFSLSLAMFLTPCVEIEAYYFQASVIGWWGILIVSAVYALITVFIMLLLVFAALKGAKNIQSHFLEHHEKLITGSVLIALALLNFFIEF